MTNVIAFPTSPHALTAARSVTETMDEQMSVAESVQSIVAEIRAEVANATPQQRARVVAWLEAMMEGVT